MKSPTTSLDPRKAHRDRYRIFIEDVADGFFETDLEGNFRFFNKALVRIFGYRASEVKGASYRKFMDDSNARIAFERFNQIYRTGQGTTGIIWEIIRPDEQRRILEISASLILDEQGEKVGFRGIARDITEKHLAQQKAVESEYLAQCQYEASRKAELRYRAFLNFLPDPVFVFNLDSTVSYLNPAFEQVFGWTLEELKGKRIPFVPEAYKEQTRRGVDQLMRQKVIHGFETKRMTKDGRLLDIVIDGAIFYDTDNQPAGQVVTLRDVTREKRVQRTNQTLFKIAEALHHYRELDGLLAFITKEIQNLLAVEAASVILLDEDKNEFFFFAITHDDTETGQRFKEIRFPADKGVAGQVYKTRQPLIVPDTAQSPYYYQKVDQKAAFHTRNMLDVPVEIQDRLIGVLCAVNKKEGPFESSDVELLSTIAHNVALPIENARINQRLQQSFEEVKSLNRAKDRVIHRLSHELKTPISVLSASLSLLEKKLLDCGDSNYQRIIDRCQRNLHRLLEMQYEIEDILRERDVTTHRMLSALLEAVKDELETLVIEQNGDERLAERVRQRIDHLFGPPDLSCGDIRLDQFVNDLLARLEPRYSHRRLELSTRIEPAGIIRIPEEVLEKIVTGLVRNAFENTPDGGGVEVAVRPAGDEAVFEVIDWGVGITAENQRLIFENYTAGPDTLLYATRRPFDFNAGGRGFDLLRIRIFSERYRFKIRLTSSRCRFIPRDEDSCPGAIEDCRHCRSVQDCNASGGTAFTLTFKAVDKTLDEPVA